METTVDYVQSWGGGLLLLKEDFSAASCLSKTYPLRCDWSVQNALEGNPLCFGDYLTVAVCMAAIPKVIAIVHGVVDPLIDPVATLQKLTVQSNLLLIIQVTYIPVWW